MNEDIVIISRRKNVWKRMSGGGNVTGLAKISVLSVEKRNCY